MADRKLANRSVASAIHARDVSGRGSAPPGANDAPPPVMLVVRPNKLDRLGMGGGEGAGVSLTLSR